MGEKILILENEPEWQDALRKLLRRTDYELCMADDCEGAEKLLEDGDFALVIINMNLADSPEMANDQLGFDLLELLVKDYPLLPRIVLTGEINGPIFSTYLPFGVNDVLYKRTLSRPQFLKAIADAIGQGSRPKEPYDRITFCALLDQHTTVQHVRRLQQSLKARYPGEISFSSYSNLSGATKLEKLDCILDVLESYREVYVAGQLLKEIKPDDRRLRNAIDEIEWS
jgi:DNA-binding NtrC family response regulator